MDIPPQISSQIKIDDLNETRTLKLSQKRERDEFGIIQASEQIALDLIWKLVQQFKIEDFEIMLDMNRKDKIRTGLINRMRTILTAKLIPVQNQRIELLQRAKEFLQINRELELEDQELQYDEVYKLHILEQLTERQDLEQQQRVEELWIKLSFELAQKFTLQELKIYLDFKNPNPERTVLVNRIRDILTDQLVPEKKDRFKIVYRTVKLISK